MLWDGKTLKVREDWENAIVSLHSQLDAQCFLDEATIHFKENAKKVVGYMIGEVCDKGERERVRSLLASIGVAHPINPDGTMTGEDLFNLGTRIRDDMDKHPTAYKWLEIVLAIGRSNGR